VNVVIEIRVFICRRVLVLLILGNQVIEVRLRLGELHFVHTLASVPVEEGAPAEHGRELLRNALEQLLNRRRVPCKRNTLAPKVGNPIDTNAVLVAALIFTVEPLFSDVSVSPSGIKVAQQAINYTKGQFTRCLIKPICAQRKFEKNIIQGNNHNVLGQNFVK